MKSYQYYLTMFLTTKTCVMFGSLRNCRFRQGELNYCFFYKKYLFNLVLTSSVYHLPTLSTHFFYFIGSSLSPLLYLTALSDFKFFPRKKLSKFPSGRFRFRSDKPIQNPLNGVPISQVKASFHAILLFLFNDSIRHPLSQLFIFSI